MNYFGINRKMPVPNKKWEGPKARLVSKEKAAEKERSLDEVIRVAKTFRSMSIEAEHIIRRALHHYREKYPSVDIHTELDDFTQRIVLVGPRRVLADEE